MPSFRDELKAERDRLRDRHKEATERERRIEALEQRGGEKFLDELRARFREDEYKGLEETNERHSAQGGRVQFAVVDADLNIVFVISGDIKYDAMAASASGEDQPSWTALRPSITVTAFRNVNGARMGGYGAAVQIRAKAGEDVFEILDLSAAMKNAGSAALKNFPGQIR